MIALDDLLAALVAHLPAHLGRQRWSGAQDRPIDSVELVWHDVVRAEQPVLLWTLARAHFAAGDSQDYQLFVGVRAAQPAPAFLQGKERELVASVDDVVIYDALVDPDLAVAVLHLVSPGTEVAVRRPIVLEHSNSSVVFDETTILKIFRKVQPGPNPDVEITRVLAAAGYQHVMPPLAELRREGTDLGVLRAFLVGATEGWHLARTSVRDVLDSGLAPDESGADFAPDAERLGAVLAGMHLAMAGAWGAAPGRAARWAAEMQANLADVMAGADLHQVVLDVGALEDCFHRIIALGDCGQEIRIHGDLHLAQVMKTDVGWKVLDFEGEPNRLRHERFTTSSPLRDLAGLLRSLGYAAATGLAEWEGEDAERSALAARWEAHNRAALVAGYLDSDGIDALLPPDPHTLAFLLRAFELDKAVYEVGYELGHRPDLVAIPLAGIARLLSLPEAELPCRLET